MRDDFNHLKIIFFKILVFVDTILGKKQRTFNMGAYLDTPIKDKNSERGINEICAWGLCSMQGWRCGMEDAHIAREI